MVQANQLQAENHKQRHITNVLIYSFVDEAYLDEELGEPECYQDGDQHEQSHGHTSSQQTHPAEEQLHPWAGWRPAACCLGRLPGSLPPIPS